MGLGDCLLTADKPGYTQKLCFLLLFWKTSSRIKAMHAQLEIPQATNIKIIR